MHMIGNNIAILLNVPNTSHPVIIVCTGERNMSLLNIR